ncbi:MAG: HalOD1 output domain-containing protein [Haloferacaceae archaeon]
MSDSSDDASLDMGGETQWRVVEQRIYERESHDDLTTVVVEAVAAAEGVDMMAIRDPSLYEIVDTSAIEDSFFGATVAGERRDSVGVVHFEYRGHRVTVRSDGWVLVAERTGRDL